MKWQLYFVLHTALRPAPAEMDLLKSIVDFVFLQLEICVTSFPRFSLEIVVGLISVGVMIFFIYKLPQIYANFNVNPEPPSGLGGDVLINPASGDAVRPIVRKSSSAFRRETENLLIMERLYKTYVERAELRRESLGDDL